MSWSSLLNRLELTLIPAAPRLHWLEGIASDPAWTLVRVLPNLMWVATVAISAAVVKKGKFAWPAAFGLLWAMTGVLAYLPWPGQGLFYMMPFAAGTMFLAAHALNGPLARGNKNRRPVFLISAALILVASLEARSTIDQHRLRANLNAGVIAEIARHGGTNLLIAAVPDPKPGTGGWSDHLRGFGEVEKGTRVIEWRDVACSEARRALDPIRGAIVVSTGGGCNELSDHSVVIADSVPRVIWPYIWKRTESQGRMYVAYAAAGRQLNDVVSMNNHD
jgi:hypothetical protein